jgi:hypothetical protein
VSKVVLSAAKVGVKKEIIAVVEVCVVNYWSGLMIWQGGCQNKLEASFFKSF